MKSHISAFSSHCNDLPVGGSKHLSEKEKKKKDWSVSEVVGNIHHKNPLFMSGLVLKSLELAVS